jgi:hypothetical protein
VQAGFGGAGQHPAQAVERLGDRAVDVVAVVGLGGAEEDRDGVDAVADLQRPVQAALVGDEHGDADAVGDVDAGEHLARVGELRDDVGADERGRLDPPQARAGETVDEAHLVLGGDHLGLVLEAVARPHLEIGRASCRERV